MRLQKIARTISWLSFTPLLSFGLYTNIFQEVGLNLVSIAVYCIIAVQVFLLLAKFYIASYRLAIMQVFLLAFALYSWLLFPDTQFTRLMATNIALPLWLLGGSVLAIVGWTCHKAIVELKRETKPENPNQPLGPGGRLKRFLGGD